MEVEEEAISQEVGISRAEAIIPEGRIIREGLVIPEEPIIRELRAVIMPGATEWGLR